MVSEAGSSLARKVQSLCVKCQLFGGLTHAENLFHVVNAEAKGATSSNSTLGLPTPATPWAMANGLTSKDAKLPVSDGAWIVDVRSVRAGRREYAMLLQGQGFRLVESVAQPVRR